MHKNFIDGRFVESSGAEQIAVLNPARGVTISHVPDTPLEMVDQAVSAARKAQVAWARRTPLERAGYLRRIAAKVREQVETIARVISEEQGKVLSLARTEASFTADYLDYMAEWARRLDASFFAELVAQTDLPPGVFNLVHGRGPTVGRAIVRNPAVGMVSFTGSVETGSAIMAEAAKNITKVNLELGGKAPAIVLADADIDLAVRAIKASRIINSGQVCNCAERIYVQRAVADEFTARFVAAMREARFGDPLADETVDMGPLIHRKAAEKVQEMVRRATADGARIATGGAMVEAGGGCYFEPTVLVDCRQDMEIMQQEIFGPVAPVHVIDSLDEAIAKANDSIYGLTSSIYTTNLSAAMKACNEIQAGETYINRENFEAMQGYHAGVHRSGIGGADGKHGLYEYTQTHMVYIQN